MPFTGEQIGVVATLFVIQLCIPVGFLLVRDRLFQPSQRSIDEFSRRFLERLQSPDFEAVEAALGHPLPAAVRGLHADRAELLRDGFDLPVEGEPGASPWRVEYYVPADAEAVVEHPEGGRRWLAFADDGCGNAYLIDPGEVDSAVYFLDHETGEWALVTGSFQDFLTRARATRISPA